MNLCRPFWNQKSFISPNNGETYVQFVIPGARKTNLALFYQARLAYDEQAWDEKLLQYA